MEVTKNKPAVLTVQLTLYPLREPWEPGELDAQLLKNVLRRMAQIWSVERAGSLQVSLVAQFIPDCQSFSESVEPCKYIEIAYWALERVEQSPYSNVFVRVK